jgi:hypothetical protein
VTTDLRQSHLLYGSPTESGLEDYRAELEELLSEGCVARYQFGFKRDEKAVWSLRYVSGQTERWLEPALPEAFRRQ